MKKNMYTFAQACLRTAALASFQLWAFASLAAGFDPPPPAGGADDFPMMPDYSISTVGGAIIITDNAGNGDELVAFQVGGNIRFATTPNTRTYSIDGNPQTTFAAPANVPLAGASSITINAGGGDDNIRFFTLTANLPDLTINGGTGNDQVVFNNNITFAPNAHLDVDLQNDDANPGVDRVVVNNDAKLILSGTGTATVKVSRDVFIGPGSRIQTENGDLTVEANQQATPTGSNSKGIDLIGMLRVTGSGATTVKGKGGDGGPTQIGMDIRSGGQIHGGTGAVTVIGAGGMGLGNHFGIVIIGAGSRITSDGGHVSVTGTGGTGGPNNYGVRVQDNGQISAGGNGTVTVTGTGGTGGSGSFRQRGVSVENGQITADGSGTVTVLGAGGASTGSENLGVLVSGANARITSGGGNVSVTGTGGGSGASNNNFGIGVELGGHITAGGSGTVTVIGTGGMSTSSNNCGVSVAGANSLITSSGGAVSVTGTGTNGANDILLQSNGRITSTSATAGITLHSTTNGTWPNTAGTDVSTGATQTTIFSAGSKLNFTINGTMVNTQYQQLAAVGRINLNNAALTFVGSTHTPLLGQTFTIVDNDGADAVIGTFKGLPEGAIIGKFLGSDLGAQITYTGGDGNDVVLEMIVCPETLTTITCPTSVPVLTADNSCRAPLGDYTDLAVVSAGCGVPTVTQAPAPGTLVNPGTVAIRLTVTGTAQEASCVFNVTISGGCGGN